MRKRIEWLRGEVDRWVREGIIGTGEGERIKALYPLGKGRSWSRLIFSSIGAVLIGLGVILFFAYNWEAMHRYARLAVVFSSILISHGLGSYFSREGSGNRVAGEAFHLLGTMLFGAGIWLVAQIYHVEEHFPNAFLIWGAGALSLAWLLPSLAQGILAAVLFVFWNGFETGYFSNPNHVGPIIILAGLLPLAWMRRSRVLLGTVIASFLIALAFTTGRTSVKLMIPVVFFMSSGFVAAGFIMRRKELFRESAPLVSLFGYLVYFPVLYGLTFRGSGLHIVHSFKDITAGVYFYSTAIMAVAVWIAMIALLKKTGENISLLIRNGIIGVPVSVVLYLAASFGLPGMKGWGAASLFNIIFLFHAVMLILEGCRSVRLGMTVNGCLLFAILAVSRYADLFESLLVRSLVFLIVGAVLFVVSAFFTRAKKGQKELML